MDKLEYNNKPKYSNLIDFDEASRLWRLNKKHLSNGYFRYKCSHYSNSKNIYCNNKLYNGNYCKFHYEKYFIIK